MCVRSRDRKLSEPKAGDPEEEVLKNFQPWVTTMIGKTTSHLPRHAVAYWDLRQEANIALLKCWRRWAEEKPDVKFVTYAYLRVRGSIIDYYRDRHALANNVRLLPWDEEVADARQAAIEGVHAPEKSVEAKMDLERALLGLHEWEHRLLDLYYVNGETLKSIGAMAGVTESRVCQIHTALIKKLRGYMEKPPLPNVA